MTRPKHKRRSSSRRQKIIIPTKPSLAGMTPEQIEALCDELGHPKFRAKQILDALYRSPALTFDDTTTLPKALRAELAERVDLIGSSVLREALSEDGTEKLLIKLNDGERIECVGIPEAKRFTCCLSSQVGCGLGCTFCASCKHGLSRNLTPAEIVEQALILCKRRMAASGKGRLAPHIVMMGVGEPLANYDNVIAAIKLLNADWGMNIGARRFTVSTVGLPDGIRMLADEKIQINLAISLHAPNNRIRNQIVPANAGIGIEKVIAAAHDFFRATHRQVTFEYVLIDGINSDIAIARQLAKCLNPRHDAVNLIPLNPIPEIGLRPPPPEQVKLFAAELRKAGMSVTTRKRRGDDISAACGQLRGTHHGASEEYEKA